MITFGSDPEFMLVDSEGVFRSAIDVVPGSKDERHSLGGDHFAYFDNVLAECAIKPGSTKQEVVDNFRDCFSRYAGLVKPLKLSPTASATYADNQIQHPEAHKFACDPEMCAYEMTVIEPPDVPTDGFRTAGGHVHIGFEGGKTIPQPSEDDFDEEIGMANNIITARRIWIVRMVDIFLGIPSLLIDRDPTSAARRRLYGSAGSHRICDEYGVEYRSLSNFWLLRPSLVELVYDVCGFVTNLVLCEKKHEQVLNWDEDGFNVRDVINAGKEPPEKYMKIVEKWLPSELFSRMNEEKSIEHNSNEFYTNWGIQP